MERRSFIQMCGAALTAFVGSGVKNTEAAVDSDRLAAHAREAFTSGRLTCGEAIVAAGGEALGVDLGVAQEAALGLAGGVGLQGGTCGCLTGAALVLSQAVARRERDRYTRKKKTFAAMAAVHRQFQQQCGATTCRQLTRTALDSPDGLRKFAARQRTQVCGKCVEAAARLLVAELNKL